MTIQRTSIFLATCGLLLTHSPGYSQPASPARTQDIIDIIALVSDSSLASTISGLQGFTTRLWSNANHEEVAESIRTDLMRFVPDVRLDSFTLSSGWQMNVVATMAGTVLPTRELIVGAHFDSYSSDPSHAPGADDNASGTAAVIEMARVLALAQYHPLMTIRFIAFAAEEAGLIGSAHYAEEARTQHRDIAAMMNYDMIGHRDTTKLTRDVYIVWYPGSEGLSKQMVNAMRSYTTLNPIQTTSYAGGSDSYSFYNQSYDAVFSIERDFSPFYHSPGDVVDKLDTHFAGDITRAGLALLLTLDQQVNAVDERSSQVAGGFRLEQNYPNPFNPSTEIGYGVQGAGDGVVTLRIYDILGREVATLVNEVKLPGTYSVRFDASGLASGVYFYRMTAGHFADTKKLIVLR